MAERGGWELIRLQTPDCVHWCIGEREKSCAADFLKDLEEAVKIARTTPLKEGSMAGIYGMAATVPDRSVVSDILMGYLDTLYKTKR